MKIREEIAPLLCIHACSNIILIIRPNTQRSSPTPRYGIDVLRLSTVHCYPKNTLVRAQNCSRCSGASLIESTRNDF